MKFIGLGFASILLFTTSSLYGHCGGCGVGGKTENKKCSEVNLVKAKKEKTEHDREMANLVGEQNSLFTKMKELLDSKDMKGNNFLTATLSKSEQIIGVPTQTQRSRKNYDLRSAPPNPQVEVSPWNMSTMEPDKGRLTFEIGESHCPPCE